MKLTDNPFYILNCSIEDTKNMIHDQAEMRSFDIDENKCKQAESILINPKKRLEAEISWLPGFNNKLIVDRAKLALEDMKTYSSELFFKKTDYYLAEANMFCFGLENVNNALFWSEKEINYVIINLCSTVEAIDVFDTIELIETSRKIAKISSNITEEEVENLIEQQRQYYKKVLYDFLNQIESNTLVKLLTEQVEKQTNNGNEYCKWSLLEQIVSSYEDEVLPFFEKQESYVKTDVDTILKKILPNSDADIYLNDWYSKLETDLLLWDRIAQPIQLLKRSRGIDDERSDHMFQLIRGLAITSHNDYYKTDFSLKIIKLCEKVFAELREATEITNKDKKILNDIEERNKREQIEEDKKMRFNHTWGLIFKESISMDTKSITINNNKRYEYDKITDLRWGITRNYRNGFETGTTRIIEFKYNNYSKEISINTDTDYTFYEVTQRLYRGPGIRIMDEILKKLKSGQTVEIANTKITDEAIQLNISHFFSSDEYKMYKWKDINKFFEMSGGSFVIKPLDSSGFSYKSYIDVDFNSIILYHMLKYFFDKGDGKRISSIM